MIQVFRYARPTFVPKVLALITLEQAITAGVTALLALAGKQFSATQDFVFYMVGLMVLSQAPLLVQIAVRWTETRGYWDMYFEFLRERLIARAGNTSAWAARDQRERFLAALGPDAELNVMTVAYTWFDSYTFFINIVLNTLALSLVIDRDFSLIFGVSMVLSYTVFYAQKEYLHRIVQKEQIQKLEVAAFVLKAWDHLLLRNASVQARFTQTLDARFGNARDSIGKSGVWSMFTVFTVSVAAALPVFAFNLYLVRAGEPGVIAALLLTFPRQLQVLVTFRNFFVQMTNLRTAGVRLKTSIENSDLKELPLEELIKLPAIRVDGQKFDDLTAVLDHVRARKTGRVLITGENGAGKSSLLLFLNARLNDSFYVPAAPDLLMDVTGSTGERLLRHVRFVAEIDVPVVMFDEWDANLDAANRDLLGRELDRLAQDRLILEVRHAR